MPRIPTPPVDLQGPLEQRNPLGNVHYPRQRIQRTQQAGCPAAGLLLQSQRLAIVVCSAGRDHRPFRPTGPAPRAPAPPAPNPDSPPPVSREVRLPRPKPARAPPHPPAFEPLLVPGFVVDAHRLGQGPRASAAPLPGRETIPDLAPPARSGHRNRRIVSGPRQRLCEQLPQRGERQLESLQRRYEKKQTRQPQIETMAAMCGALHRPILYDRLSPPMLDCRKERPILSPAFFVGNTRPVRPRQTAEPRGCWHSLGRSAGDLPVFRAGLGRRLVFEAAHPGEPRLLLCGKGRRAVAGRSEFRSRKPGDFRTAGVVGGG